MRSVKQIRKIESWHSGGDKIWFYFKGVADSVEVPADVIAKVRRDAVTMFKQQLKKMLDPHVI